MVVMRIWVVAVISLLACKSEDATATFTTGSGSDPVAAPAEPPGKLTRERLEKSLKKHLEEYGFSRFTCHEVAVAETSTTCEVSADNGVKTEVPVTIGKRSPDGSWSSWNFDLKQRVITAGELAEKLHDTVMAALKKAQPKATGELACGTSPIVFVDHKAKCTLTMHDPDRAIEITIDDTKDAFDWSADQF